MKQIEATKERPFYSVGYQYERDPWTVHSVNCFNGNPTGAPKGRTMQGTDSLPLAMKTAELCLQDASVNMAWVHVSYDCYNHPEVAQFERGKPVVLDNHAKLLERLKTLTCWK